MHRIKLQVLVCLFLSAIWILPAAVKQVISQPDTLLLGSKIYLTLSADRELTGIIPPDSLENFAILSVEKLSSQTSPNSLKITLIPIDTGQQTFPALLLQSNPVSTDTLRTSPFTLMIKESRAPGDSTLVDIFPPQKLRGELPLWAYYLIAGLFILGIIGIVIWLMVRNRRQKHLKQPEIIPPVITKPAWQLALDELSALQVLQLPEKQEFIAFHFRLSDIMKQYLETELGFNAKEMTTREIRQHFHLVEQHADAAQGHVLCSGLPTPTPNSLPNCVTSINVEQHADAAKTQATANSLIPQDRYPALHSILPAEQKALIQWLEKNDRVKFAKYVPDTETCYQSLDWAMQWFKLQSLNASANAGQTHSHA